MKIVGASWGWRVAAFLVAGLAALSLAGCATTGAPSSVTLDGIIADGQRVAQPGEAGLVRIYRDGRWIEGQPHMSLQTGDVVATGPRGYAVIRYPSGTELYMRPESRGRIGSFTDLIGEVFAKIRGAFAIQTEFVKAGAEGTAYLVRSAPNGESTVIVFDGTVGMSSLAGAWPPYRVGTGSMTVTQPRGSSPRAMRASADELARTRAWVERMETLAPPSRHINQAGTALAIAGLVAIIAASQASGDSAPQRDAAASLAAPVHATPGSTTPDRPAVLYDCRSLRLSWSAVAGARDYAVTLDAASSVNQGAWRTVATAPTSDMQLGIGDTLQLNTLYRWVVRAHDARGHAGAATSALYFACRGSIR